MRLQRTSLDNFHATARAQRADELARAYVDAVLARTFLSYAHEGVRSRTATKKYYAGLRNSFSDSYFHVHENIGVLVENDLVALRTIVAGVHTGDYADVRATGRQVQTSVSQQRPSMPGATTVTAIHGAGSDRPRPPRPRRSPPHRRGRNVVVAHIVIGVDRSDNRGCKLAQRVIDQLEELA
jgi:SnoaL-like polyketide cyclase